MANSADVIIRNIKQYMDKWDWPYSSWYVGITKDAENRLFNDHKVDRDNGAWIYDTASSANVARDIEDYFLNQLGTDGKGGGGDEESKIVYAYKKTKNTKP